MGGINSGAGRRRQQKDRDRGVRVVFSSALYVWWGGGEKDKGAGGGGKRSEHPSLAQACTEACCTRFNSIDR
jgi:hypothetical protein